MVELLFILLILLSLSILFLVSFVVFIYLFSWFDLNILRFLCIKVWVNSRALELIIWERYSTVSFFHIMFCLEFGWMGRGYLKIGSFIYINATTGSGPVILLLLVLLSSIFLFFTLFYKRVSWLRWGCFIFFFVRYLFNYFFNH